MVWMDQMHVYRLIYGQRQELHRMLSACDTRQKICHQIHTTFLLIPSALGTLRHLFTAIQTTWSSPTASLSSALRFFSSMSSWMASDTTHLGQLAGTSRLLCMCSFWGHLRSTPMEKSLSFSSSTKTFTKLASRCGLPECDGSNPGLENARKYGTTCECPLYCPVVITNLRSSSIVNVHLWELGEYQDPEARLPALINPDWIKGQLTVISILFPVATPV